LPPDGASAVEPLAPPSSGFVPSACLGIPV